MSEYIFETIVTSRREDGSAHIVPLGIRYQDEFVVLAPFRPSATLTNVLRERRAVVNYTDDVRVFAGTLTGRNDWPLADAHGCPRLANALAYTALELVRVDDDAQRPRLVCRQQSMQTLAPFRGFNRAQAAVVEACILVSRLHLLPEAKIRSEIEYLEIAIQKTAGPKEFEAWNWLIEKIEAHYRSTPLAGAIAPAPGSSPASDRSTKPG
jgi:uncharacterized protein